MVADRPLRPHHRVVGQLDLVDPAAYAVLAGAIGGDRPPLAGGGVDDADLAAAVGKPASVGDQVVPPPCGSSITFWVSVPVTTYTPFGPDPRPLG